MVDFKKIMNQTPEEREETRRLARERQDQIDAEELKKVEAITERINAVMQHESVLSEKNMRFIRSLHNLSTTYDYSARIGGGLVHLSSKQTEYLDSLYSQYGKTNTADTNPDNHNERFTFFFGGDGPFSNWHKSTFELDGLEFSCVEQYMMYRKALLFGDHEVANRIMDETRQSEIKALGRKVHPYNDDTWGRYRKQVVLDGCRAKFTQNKHLFDALLATEGTTMVEASPYDKIWGIGLAATDVRASDRSQWRGENLLGQVLDKLRTELLLEHKPPAVKKTLRF